MSGWDAGAWRAVIAPMPSMCQMLPNSALQQTWSSLSLGPRS